VRRKAFTHLSSRGQREGRGGVEASISMLSMKEKNPHNLAKTETKEKRVE
jgi:hypothetical protein